MNYDNPSFIDDIFSTQPSVLTKYHENKKTGVHIKELNEINPANVAQYDTNEKTPAARETWGHGMEFLMSCIAMSVGLGNVWRFPFTALENGGGAFLIPYLIVLFVIGRPIYYMEMLIGQFSSRGSVKVFNMVPALRGVGIGQVISIGIVSTYYVALMAITLKYFLDSFKTILPWSICDEEWGSACVASSLKNTNISFTDLSNITTVKKISSAELYFSKGVLKEIDSIHDGIGIPNLELTLCLAAAWIIIVGTLIKGVRTSGKASYFLALFPYVIMVILFIRACTLSGSSAGIYYFIRPQWDKILSPKVWYAAVTQCFFSLSICFGNIIMYASFNKFDHDVYRDATIISILDTFTSLLAGLTIFGVLGHLAHELGISDIGTVIKGGTGLAFISYPDAIAKFDWLPQVFSVLFFFMLFILGIGSNIAMSSCIMTAIRDQFPKVKHWHASVCIGCVGLGFGTIYITPGGQFVLNLVDFFGASLIAFVLAIGELVAVSWIYGVDRLCRDAEFMIGKKPGIYWRLCWGILSPLLMFVILAYTIFTYEPLKYRTYIYPNSAYAAGWVITCLGVFQLPLWAFIAIIRQPGNSWKEKLYGAFQPTDHWGPKDPILYERYQKHLNEVESSKMFEKDGVLWRIRNKIFG